MQMDFATSPMVSPAIASSPRGRGAWKNVGIVKIGNLKRVDESPLPTLHLKSSVSRKWSDAVGFQTCSRRRYKQPKTRSFAASTVS
jgi:hypothetical protein